MLSLARGTDDTTQHVHQNIVELMVSRHGHGAVEGGKGNYLLRKWVFGVFSVSFLDGHF